MKLIVEQSDEYKETVIHIQCAMIDDALKSVIDELQFRMFSMVVHKDGAIHKLPLDDVYFFESTDEKTFVYCEHEVYECAYKLYEVEERVENFCFVRISKSVIVNINKIVNIRPQFNGRFDALLDNGEHQIVSRHYVNRLKNKFEGDAGI